MMKPKNKFEDYNDEVENRLRKTVRALRLDRGGEYTAHKFMFVNLVVLFMKQLHPIHPNKTGVGGRKAICFIQTGGRGSHHILEGYVRS